MSVKGSEMMQILLVEAVVEDRLGWPEVEVAQLRGLEAFGRMGFLVVTGLGWEAGGQNGPVQVEGLGQRNHNLAREAEALVCWVEGVEVQQLQYSGTRRVTLQHSLTLVCKGK